MPTEIRREFHHQLDDIRRLIVRLGALVTESIPRGTEALLGNDLRAAQELIDGDDEIDALALDIEERCYSLLARQQPMAQDLRAIVTAIRLVAEIERSGDLMVNVCKALRRIYPLEMPPVIRGQIETMNDQAARLFRLCMDAYADGNAGLAAALEDMDDSLDVVHAEYIQEVLTWGGAGDIKSAVQLALVGRYYERIGDHAVNVGERVRYMVDGWLPEHTGAARAEARRQSSAEGHDTPAGDVDAPDAPAAGGDVGHGAVESEGPEQR